MNSGKLSWQDSSNKIDREIIRRAFKIANIELGPRAIQGIGVVPYSLTDIMKNSKISFQKNHEDNFRFKRIKSIIDNNAHIKKEYDEYNNNVIIFKKVLFF